MTNQILITLDLIDEFGIPISFVFLCNCIVGFNVLDKTLKQSHLLTLYGNYQDWNINLDTKEAIHTIDHHVESLNVKYTFVKLTIG